MAWVGLATIPLHGAGAQDPAEIYPIRGDAIPAPRQQLILAGPVLPPIVSPVPQVVEAEFSIDSLGDESAVETNFDTHLESSLALDPRMVGYELHRDGASWLVGEGDDLGLFSLEGSGSLDITGLNNLFSGHAVHFVDGPVQTNMPPRLFELYFGYRAIGDFGPDWSYDVTISPGIYTDFEGHAHQGWRIRGVGLVKHHFDPGIDLVLGVAYLDRENLKLLPVAGLVLDLDGRTRLELVFPEPRLSTLYETDEGWKTLYLRGQLGGGSWAIERDSRANDIATYEDLRVYLGIESEDDDEETKFVELGYVFDRELEYRSGIGNMRFSETLMLRSGVRY